MLVCRRFSSVNTTEYVLFRGVGRGQRRVHFKWDKEAKRGREQECRTQQQISMSSKRWSRKEKDSCTK